MISEIKIRNYKGIKATPWIPLKPLHVLVGPNGSGKSTFLDAIDFVKACTVNGPLKAVEDRVPEFRDLTFLRRGGPIEFDLRMKLSQAQGDDPGILHYRFGVTSDELLGVRVTEELLTRTSPGIRKPKRILGKTQSGTDFYRRDNGTYTDSFQFGPGRLALSLTPADKTKYRTGNAVKEFLSQGIRFIQLNSAAMRQPAPATSPIDLALDGTNLARVVGRMIRNGGANPSNGRASDALERWTKHLHYAIEDLESIGWAARQADNAEYLILKFAGGLECPSWLLSDGTLRMLALTLLAFLRGSPSLYMVEEPENGVHPYALEIILKALAAIPDSQVFVATHSPLVVQQVGPGPLLCFTRDAKTGVHITRGPVHPALKDWNGNPDLASIFAARVFG